MTSLADELNNSRIDTVWSVDGQSVQQSEAGGVLLSNGGLLIPFVSRHNENDDIDVIHNYCCQLDHKKPACASMRVLPSSGKSQSPTLVAEPFDIFIKEGETGVTQCVGNGVPPPTVTWFKENGTKVIADNEDVFMSAVLKITNAQVEDSGIYYCIVENSFGQINHSISVVVLGIVRVCFPYYCYFDYQYFVHLGSPRVKFVFDDNVWIPRGKQAYLVCPIERTAYPRSISKFVPKLQIAWLFNATEISSTDNGLQILPNDTLLINSTSFASEGMYQCFVENVYSSVQVTFRLRSYGN